MAKILLVEDENIINMVMQDRLELMGHTVCGTAASGQQAIQMAESAHPDVVIMDITLRGKMDGIEAASQIGSLFGIPIIYLTAYGDEETRRRAGDTHPVAYLVKTFEDVGLKSAIDKAVSRGRERPQEPLGGGRCQRVGDITVRVTPSPETQR